MNPVVFNHKNHEAATESCRTCHHAKITDTGCVGCHTADGKTEGKNINLADAMHKADSQSSCVGCHAKTMASRPECAGCHYGIKAGKEGSCTVCHAPAGGTVTAEQVCAMSREQRRALAAAALAAKPGAKPVPASEVPETVKIDMLSTDYEAAVMPHRKIYEKLMAGVGSDALAGKFHASPETVCGACHHNVPVTQLKQPPKCATCHGAKADKMPVKTNMPSLKAAYHQQCIACHTRMDVKPVASDCAGCHAKRGQAKK